MKKFTINSTLHEPEIFYVNHEGSGWLTNKNKTKFYKDMNRNYQSSHKEYYLFINLYPTHA